MLSSLSYNILMGQTHLNIWTMPSTLYVAENGITMETTIKRKGWWKSGWKRGMPVVQRYSKMERGQRGREEFMPKGERCRDDTMHQLSSFDLRAQPSTVTKREQLSLSKPKRNWGEKRLWKSWSWLYYILISHSAIQYGMFVQYLTGKEIIGSL